MDGEIQKLRVTREDLSLREEHRGRCRGDNQRGKVGSECKLRHWPTKDGRSDRMSRRR